MASPKPAGEPQFQKNRVAVVALVLAILSLVCIPGRSSSEQIAIPGGFALGFTCVGLYRLFFQRNRWDRQHYTLIAALLNAFGIYMGVAAYLRQQPLQAAESASPPKARPTLLEAMGAQQPAAPPPGGTYLDRAIARFDQQLRATPETAAFLSQVPDAERAARVNALSLKGLHLLPSEVLVRRLELQLAMLARTDAATCADLARGQGAAASIERGLRTLDETELRDWYDGMFAAASAEARHDQAASPPPKDVEKAFGALFVAAPRADAERAGRLLEKDVALLPDADACWLARFLAQQTLKAPEPRKSTLARELAGH